MVVGCGGNAYHLAAQSFHQRTAFCFWINNENIVICRQRQLDHLPLGTEGFAGAGHAQIEAVPVEQLPAVGEDQVLGDGVLPIVKPALSLHLRYFKADLTTPAHQSYHATN